MDFEMSKSRCLLLLELDTVLLEFLDLFAVKWPCFLNSILPTYFSIK